MGAVRYTLMLGAILAAVLASAGWRGDEAPAGAPLAARLPLVIGRWHGVDLEVEEETLAILESRDVVVRRYEARDERPVFLTMAVSSRSRKVAHPPEICYAGYGFEIMRREVRVLGHSSKREVVVIDAVRGERREVVAGWYRAGGKITASFISQQLRLMGAQLLGGPARAAMIRVATRAEGELFEEAVARLERFMDDISGPLDILR